MALDINIEWLDSIDSTNNEVRRRIPGIDNLSVLAARWQTAGRGQGDHKWQSQADCNLTFSLHLSWDDGRLSPLKASDVLLLTEVITHAMRHYLLSKGINARIKWPNDIYVGDLKICGILIENILKGEYISHSIIGAGININQTEFAADIPNPVSVAALTGKQYDIKEELRTLCSYLSLSTELLNSPEGRQELDREFGEHMFRLPSKP